MSDDRKVINVHGSSLNYVKWSLGQEVFCADKNSPGDRTRGLQEYVDDFRTAPTTDAKLEVAAAFSGCQWEMGIPQIDCCGLQLNVGDVENEYWTYSPARGDLVQLKIAAHGASLGKPVMVVVRPVKDIAEYTSTNGAAIVVEGTA